MKPTIKAALLGAIFVICSIVVLTPLLPLKAQAAVGGGEQYKILDTEKFFRQGNSAPLEAELNRLGADGWKIRATIADKIIFAK